MHADDAGSAPGGIDDGVGHPPAKLMGDLKAHGLFALGAARFFQSGQVEQTLLGGNRHGDAPGVADQAVDEVEFGAGDDGLLLVGRGRILGHEDLDWGAGAGAIGGGGSGGVAR